jgi:neutral ceramidase
MRLEMRVILFLFILFFSFFSFSSYAGSSCQQAETYYIGTGIHDITGPAAEEGMMGYAMLNQKTAGILQRLWARAFIIASPCNGKRVVFVNADLGQIFQALKQQVIIKLQAKYGDLYQQDNVLLTATHTHSGPGGYSTYALYNLTTLGFSRENFDTIVNGITAAISDAHDHMVPGKINLAAGQLTGITYNRSPTAYLLNPKSERAWYQQDVDTDMTLIRFDDENGQSLGLINWFPIHGVSLNNKNHFIHGDNKGYAEYLFEKEQGKPFVAAFAQSNAGDVSPNPLGHEGGEGNAGLQAIVQAGNPQYEKAKDLFANANLPLQGGVDYRHTFVAMDKVTVMPAFTHGQPETTCPAAIGISMLAGTQDGEGIGWQGITCDDLSNWHLPKLICEFITTRCQGAKPIAVTTGNMKPYPWTPQILPLQIIQIGQLIIAAVPFELTTMTGRRLKAALARQFPSNYHIVLSTLANAYAGYVATQEEYQLQRYEGASTHFGPWTAAALEQEFSKLGRALFAGELVAAGEVPIDLLDHQIDMQTGVWIDTAPLGKQFGDIDEDVKADYQPGETATIVFWGAHPKNNYRIQDTFLTVEKLMSDGQWKIIYNDNDWETAYHWERNGIASSRVTITWHIPMDSEKGQYRITHSGEAKSLLGNITSYKGISSVFNVR